ncbi:bacillithiol system redox-active protein YtxJ [Eisenibacter elegans]|jgi:bacillithiol system protein YtxJ|uniref:bacillithiol system redox-active protein YtxJ n=1 Tax=Eisenibacter elegans TaxID=997 RepID=UPI00041B770E|nr:bacillithiol system redox-active protein YtxJ [Eisenibacter elegans]
MNITWIPLRQASQIAEAVAVSQQQPVLIFKHSHRCNISASALNRLERRWEADFGHKIQCYMVDVVADRPTSLQLAEELGVYHESPQAIVLAQGKVQYHESHLGITYEAIREAAEQ